MDENIQLFLGDCLEVMDKLIEQGVKVDAVITDPPYGTTKCKWDSIIPFDEMWKRLKLLRNDNTPIVLFGSEPFSSALRMSNTKEYKYDWIWEKSKATNFLNAKKQPLRAYEAISVFYKQQCKYNPQMVELENPITIKRTQNLDNISITNKFNTIPQSNYTHSHPKNILKFNNEMFLHPTQKPVALLEYLIKTYTNEGDLVLDFTAGSFSTGVACVNTNRKFIGIELDENYFEIGKNRINQLKTID
jgi:site-specific DNA-methyltransferase (adenine-specific)